MVRAGVVAHPSLWRWGGHDEMSGQRARYRLLDLNRLLESLDVASLAEYRALYQQGIEEAIQRRAIAREPEWTETLAVGNREFVERACSVYAARQKLVYAAACGEEAGATWTIRDKSFSYSPVSGVIPTA